MSLRGNLRADFPRGWWRSTRWWAECVKDVAGFAAIALAPALLTNNIRTVMTHRHEPRALARVESGLDAYMASCFLQAIGIFFCVSMGLRPPAFETWVLACAIGLYCTLNFLAAVLVTVLVFRSRFTDRFEWSIVDFIEEHAPKEGQPPETVKEYEAQRLREQGWQNF